MPKRSYLQAFTLMELLIVMVLMGILLSLSSGFTRRARDTFTAQQHIKTMLLESRILRRKSMLVARSASEKSWVYGIGFQLEKVNGVSGEKIWEFSEINLTSDTVNSRFYRAFPGINGGSLISNLLNESASKTKLSKGLSFSIISDNGNTASNNVDKNCLNSIDFESLFVIFETINGKMHAYCKTASSGGFKVLGGNGNNYDSDIKSTDTPSINIQIKYDAGGEFRYKLHIQSNGEISITAQ